MDMNMNMNMQSKVPPVPWLDQPVMLHSSREDKCKLSAAQCAYRNYRWRYWYEADHVYALNTVYFLCAVIGVFTISNILVRFAPEWLKRTRIWRTTTSASRYLAYRGYRLPALRYWAPSLGVILLGLAGAVFFLAMTLGPQPYYWPKDANYGSSPPIATRAGWMALALLPFILALSVKANMISAITGIPPEKLQVFHHWTSYAMFVLALIHTFPFIIFHIQKGDMVKEWKTNIVYWTGIPALLSQTYLTVMSLPSIRNRFYEFFKATHLFAALIFVVFFFLHCDFRLSSWDYFIASGALYLLLITAHIRTYLMHGLHTATLELLPSGLVRVAVPTNVKWTPGQHVFVRFITSDLHLLTAHPFTISSVCKDTDPNGRDSELIFYIKPRQGVTARLAALARQRPGCKKKIFIEGPYGGVSAHHLARFDTILVIAGGSGGGFSLAMVDEALRLTSLTKQGKSFPQGHRSLQVIFATRDTAMADWYVEEIESRLTHSTELLADSVYGYETSVSVHITSPPLTSQSMATVDSGRGSMSDERKKMPVESTTTGMFSLNVHRDARPDIPGLIARTAGVSRLQTAHEGQRKRIGVLVCGPASMLHDTRNATALAQARALDGDVEEIYLHSEPFA
ncbi:hypothetical protein N7450_007146 [Penicillium hetheringtonii]|uniref:ferric-chelate reductase (NADPH) n=1 Tax=Penicillium hetheringtonii TaxID=911720 RepID=A0AAD6DGU7_9EURO|nr:hypothetical protein N7450_007146 [Penicillium hetheringtonii]